MTTVANGEDTAHAPSDSAMDLLKAVRAEAGESDLVPVDEADIDLSSQDQAQEKPDAEEKPEKSAETDQFIEIVEEDGKDPVRIPVAEVVSAYREMKELEGKVESVISGAEQHVQLRAQQAYEQQDLMLQQTQHQLAIMHEALRRMAPQPPPMDMLNAQSEKYDPDGYHRALAIHGQVTGAFSQIDQQLRQLEAERQQAWQGRQTAYLDAEMQKLQRSDPEWRTNADTKAAELRAVMREHYGFDDETLFSIGDSRFFQAASDLVKYHKLMKSGAQTKAQVQGKAPPPTKVTKPNQQTGSPRSADGRFVAEAAKQLSNGPYTADKGRSFFEGLIRAGKI